MGNAGLDEAQTRVKIAGRNISNLRYVDDYTLFFFYRSILFITINKKTINKKLAVKIQHHK